MAMKGRTTCAVDGCTNPIYEPNNLSDEHRLPGGVMKVGESTMVITAWYAERGGECGVILLNDSALGRHFGGRKGFEAKLAEQGFVNVRNLATPEELEAAKQAPKGKKLGNWSGPWETTYPWEAN